MNWGWIRQRDGHRDRIDGLESRRARHAFGADLDVDGRAELVIRSLEFSGYSACRTSAPVSQIHPTRSGRELEGCRERSPAHWMVHQFWPRQNLDSRAAVDRVAALGSRPAPSSLTSIQYGHGDGWTPDGDDRHTVA